MFDKEKYGRLLVPIVTPFKADMAVDYDAIVQIANRLIEKNYADSLVLTGTTGEFFTMSIDERKKVFQVLKSAVGARIPLIPGTGCAATHETISLTRSAQEMGFELVMIVAPYYTKPTQQEVREHFAAIAGEVEIDIMLYNIPIFTGVNIEPDTVAELARIPNIVGIKEEAELRPKQMTEYLSVTPDDFIVYCGDDSMVLEALAQGGERIGGFVTGGAHVAGKLIREMIAAFLDGDVLTAGRMQRDLLPLYRSLSPNGRTNPVSLLKGAMAMADALAALAGNGGRTGGCSSSYGAPLAVVSALDRRVDHD